MTVGPDVRFLEAAVDSILIQTFLDFEFIIVDDMPQRQEISALAQHDPRIRIIANQTNLGSAAAANRGIEAARADVIVRLDADDVAEPARLQRLVAALDANPSLGLVGSWFATMTERGEQREVIRLPETDLEVRWSFLFSNPFCHSAVAFRRACFEAAGRYRPELRMLEDIDLWARMLTICRSANIPEVLAGYRLNQAGLTATRDEEWDTRLDALREPYWRGLRVRYDRATAQALAIFVAGYDLPPAIERVSTYQTLLTLLCRFLTAPRPLSNAEDELIARRFMHQCIRRIAADPAISYRALIALCRLCLRLRPTVAIALACAVAQHASGMLRSQN